jgi:hypothetical protein
VQGIGGGGVKFDLPDSVQELVMARNELKKHFSSVDLRFTFDGNLVGDLGEAVAAELFDIELTGRGKEAIDGYYSLDRRTVQVKASGTSRGAAFRKVESKADHLLFFHFNYDECYGEVIYNGPEEPVKASLPEFSTGQRIISVTTLRRLNANVKSADRLPIKPQKAK